MMIGKTISHYKILEKLGEGGMGVVYKAEDTKLKRIVALKFLPPELTRDPKANLRFIQEAQAASALDHPHICIIYDIDETEDGQMFICMACYGGEVLEQKIMQGPLELERAVDITIQVAQGLAEAHRQEIVHQDIKPANIFITEDDQVKILDFGLAKLAGEIQSEKAGAILGTTTYMSPEQARGEEVDHRTDIWSLGVVLYEMVAGQPPFRGDYEQAVVYSILNEDPKPLTELRASVPAEFESVVTKALAKSPGERYQRIDEMLAHLEELKEELESPLLAQRPIAVISFENQTGDKKYDYLQKAIPNLLITSLERSESLRVITWERMRDLLRQVGKENVEVIDRDLGFQLCRLDGIDAIVLGTYTKAGETFATDVKVLDVSTKQLLVSASSKGVGVDSILKAQIDELSRDISRGLGISERKMVDGGQPIADVTTSSMEAYRYFLRGRESYEKLYNQDARRSLQKAVELDPTFAVAYLYLAWIYDRLRDTKARNDAFEKAKAFSNRATSKERLYIEAACARALERDVEKRFQILKQIAREYPKEKHVHHRLASHYRGKKQFYQAVEEYKKVLELDPNYGWALNELAYMYTDIEDFEQAHEYFQRYTLISPGDANPIDSMGELYFRMGKLDDAIAKYKEALKVKPDFYYAYWEIAYIYALKENYSECMKWIDKHLDKAPSFGTRTDGLRWRSFYRIWGSSLNRALNEAERMTELSKAEGSEGWQTEANRLKGWIYYEKGEFELSRNCFLQCIDAMQRNPKEYIPAATSYSLGSPEQVASLTAALVFALALVDLKEGRIDSAKSKLAEIKPFMPDYAELLRGELLLAEGSLEKAITVCEEAPAWGIPYMSDTGGMLAYNLPFLKDVLARAYRQKGNLDGAIAEYERLTTFHPYSRDRRLIHPKYRYRLAQLYQEKGRLRKASEQYQKLLEIWEEADRDLPELADAKSKLNQISGKK
jgi:serine/threonine protein kinase/Flp pilus assembly protein TadD